MTQPLHHNPDMNEPEPSFALQPRAQAQATLPLQRPTAHFMLAHPAHAVALGFGSGLSPKAPGTVGTLWAWMAFLALQPWMNDARWALLIAASLPLGWWACTLTARDMGIADPGSIVWDEVAAFWLVLWLVTPAGWVDQLLAFGLFRFFDAVKPGPVAWADQLFHRQARSGTASGWRLAGLGIMLDDLVAAACTLLVMALWRIA
jgi:phosphatidylglycerophosphatase A